MSSIKIRIKPQNGKFLIRLLITHPMETGRRRDSVAGTIVPAHFIETVHVEHNGDLIARCHFGTGVSRDPYLSLRLRGGSPGDRIRVSWIDNLGQSDSAEATLP